MTTNQVEYAKHIETVRHQKRTEGIQQQQADAQTTSALAAREQARVAGIQVGVAQGQLAETQRANLERERVNWWQAQEAGRHNRTLEDLQSRSVASTERLNFQQGQAALKQAESAASQAVTASRRADIEESRVGIQSFDAQTQRMLASIAGMNASTARLQAQESARHNIVSELLSQDQLSEQHRHNVAGEIVATRDSYTRKAGLNVQQQQADAATMSAEAAKSQATSSRIKAVTGAVNTGYNISSDLLSKLSPVIARQTAIRRLLG